MKQKEIICFSERVCDTVYVYENDTTDDFICKDIFKPKCVEKWKKLYETTCRTQNRFDCDPKKHGYGGNGIDSHREVVNYADRSDSDGHKNTNYRNGEPTKEIFENFKCHQEPVKRCYKTPRRVKTQKCNEITERKCQKVTNQNPRLVEKQKCHDKTYEKCEVRKEPTYEKIQLPKYEVHCENVPRQICDSQGRKKLEVACANDTRPTCKWIPKKKKCTKIPKEHCTDLPYKVKTVVCDESYKNEVGSAEYGGPGYVGSEHGGQVHPVVASRYDDSEYPIGAISQDGGISSKKK